LWDFGDGDFSTQVGTTGNQFAPGACYDLALTLTAPSGCTATAFHEQAFCAFESPVAGFTADPVVTTTIDPEVTFENQSVFATSFHWDFGDGAQSFDDNPVHSYAQAGTYVVKLTASNAEVCFREATLPIVIKPLLQVYVPNAFTADHDGINDAWRPVLSNPELLDGYRLTVFNRWGERVFETEDPEAWWVGDSSAPDGVQGTYFVPNEVYSWRLVLDVREGVAFDCASGAPLFDVRKGGSDCTLTGHVTLIR
jgi:PKD repeat protein